MKIIVKEKKFWTWKTVLWCFIGAVFLIIAGYFTFIGFEFKR